MFDNSCHSCPALHCRTGLVAPRDNHSLAGGPLFCANQPSTDPHPCLTAGIRLGGIGSLVDCVCVCGLCMVCGGVHAATGTQRQVWKASVTKCSKVYRSGPVRSVCRDRSHRSLKPALLCFLEILFNLRKPLKPSIRPPFKTLDPVVAQQVKNFPTRPSRSSVRSGSQRNVWNAGPKIKY